MEQAGPETQGSVRDFPCEQCGAKLEFKAGSGDKLVCGYCGHSHTIAQPEVRKIVEYSFEEAKHGARKQSARDLVAGGQEVHCTFCGARSVVAGKADHCAFCGSPVVLEEAPDAVIRPESVLPFAIEKNRAKEIFKEWIASLWFAPNDLKTRAQATGMDGVYLPYWTYDSETQTRYVGQRGVHYYVTEHYTDSEGKRQSRQVQKTRWYPAAGWVDRSFDDVLICASKSLPRHLIEGLEPWNLGSLANYDPGYLSGFVAERYAIDLEAGFDVAKHRMDPEIQTEIRMDIGGDEQRIWSYDTSYTDVTFKHFLLPLFISAFNYDGKVYRFIVNAQTGAANGERPWSTIKIVAAVVGALAIIALVIFLVMKFKQ